MTSEMSKTKRGLIAALFALVLAVGLVPAAAFADALVGAEVDDSNAAASVDVYVSVSNAGTLALAHEKVTVSDVDKDGKFTYDEALQATHEQFCKGGYATVVTEWGLSVTKLWNVENGGSYLFMKNNEMTSAVGAETVAAGDELIAVVMEDTTGYTDHVGYFEKQTLAGTTADTFELNLQAVYGMGFPATPVAAPDVQIGTWKDGEFTPIDGKKTDKDGKVELTFDKPGTYVVSAKGSIEGEVDVYDENWNVSKETKECPLSAPVCVISVGTPMYRLYNPNSGEHFYTADDNEQAYLVSIGWTDEGTGWLAPVESDAPVYRLYNRNAGDHHYTLDADERAYLISVGWEDEEIGWYSADETGTPLYRQYNPNAKGAGSHNYTADENEKDYLVSIGWNDEGIGWYGLPADDK